MNITDQANPSILRGVPSWVYAIILALASIEPVTHFWLTSIDGPERYFSGLHTADSAIYLQSMRMFETGFFSPYATCRTENGPNDPALFPTPFHWLYGMAGALARLVRMDNFLFLGLVNGVIGALYLVAVYRLFTSIASDRASLAFLIWALGGGLGGIAYVATGAMGLHDLPNFDRYFERFSMYELVEGPYLSPALHLPRLYYTLSLALCLGGLTAFIASVRISCRRHFGFAALLLFGGALVNPRFGAQAWFVAGLYLFVASSLSFGGKVRLAGALAAPVTLAGLASWSLMARNPEFLENTALLVRESAWPTALLSAGLLQFPLVFVVGRKIWPQFTRNEAILGKICAGYLAVFAGLFIAYGAYHGTLFRAGDATAANRVSDFALLGAAAWLLLRWPKATPGATGDRTLIFILLWSLIFAVLSMSAFGQGWFIRLAPQRLMVFLGLPMAVLSAAAIQEIRKTMPRLAAGYASVIVACGTTSILVGALYFQGPLQRRPGEGPFARLHPEIISAADQSLLEQLGGLPRGYVLAPEPMSDIVAVRTEMSVLGGAGSTDLSDVKSVKITPEINQFFSTNASDSDRRAFLDAWCIDYVYCSDTWPVPEAVVERLAATPDLRLIAAEGRGRLFAATNHRS